MTLDCAALQSIVKSLPVVEECGVLRNGALRMATPFLYPNGSHIDIFLEPGKNLFTSHRLSDYGQTALYLREGQVKVTPRRKEIISEICSELDVAFADGTLHVDISDEEITNISATILRLVQACIRVSDLSYQHSLRAPNPFRDTVRAFFEASDVKFSRDQDVSSAFDETVKIDFEIKGMTKPSFVLAMAATDEQSAHNSFLQIFAKWHDIQQHLQTHKFVTVYRAEKGVSFRNGDLQRLTQWSSVFPFPAQNQQLLEAVNS